MSTSTDTELTVVIHPAIRKVGLRMHAAGVELRITAEDADRISRELEAEIAARGHASVITVSLDEGNAIEVATAEAKRLVIELARAAREATGGPAPRKTDKERAYINDSIALGRARTKQSATEIARKMIADGQDLTAVLGKLYATANSRGFEAGQRDAMG